MSIHPTTLLGQDVELHLHSDTYVTFMGVVEVNRIGYALRSSWKREDYGWRCEYGGIYRDTEDWWQRDNITRGAAGKLYHAMRDALDGLDVTVLTNARREHLLREADSKDQSAERLREQADALVRDAADLRTEARSL